MNKSMKIIYLLSGMPGSGKSSLINSLSLESNTISLDTFRELFSGLSLGVDGNINISQKHNYYIMPFFKKALEKRMEEESIIVIDNLNNKVSDNNYYFKIAKENGYTVKIVDFELKDIEFYIKRNKERPERKRLSQDSIFKLYDIFSNIDKSQRLPETITVSEFFNEVNTCVDDLSVDLNNYKNIHHIGDIMGNKKNLELLLKNFSNDDFYIFTGNYFAEIELVDEIIESLTSFFYKDNVVFLKGSFDGKINEFKNKKSVTESASYVEKNNLIVDFNLQLKPYFIYSFGDRNVFVSSAGVSNVPLRPYLLNSSVYYDGVGGDEFDIDNSFNNNSNGKWIQVHGSRGFNNASDLSDSKILSYSLAPNKFSFFCLNELVLNDENLVFNYYESNEVSSYYNDRMLQLNFNIKKSSTNIELKNATKVRKINDATLYEFEGYNVYSVKEQIIHIEKKSENFYAIVEDKTNSSFYISSNNGNVVFTDKDFKLADVKLDKYIYDLCSKYNVLIEINLNKDNKIEIVDIYNCDVERNMLKKELYPSEHIHKKSYLKFNDKKSLDGFIQHILKKGCSEDYIVKLNDGKTFNLNSYLKQKSTKPRF